MVSCRHKGVVILRGSVTALLLVLCLTGAHAITYHGGLTTAASHSDPDFVVDGIDGTGFWIDPGDTSLEWWVSQTLPTDPWHYKYVLTTPGPGGAPSHFIIETTNPFTEGNPDYFNATGSFGSDTVSLHLGPSPGNPFMPDDVYGIKFDQLSGAIVVTFEFDSFRNPVWGDFYSKCGKTGGIQNTAWNKGLTDNDTDPNLVPSNGSLNFHVLRPNGETQDIPEPGTMVLFGLGLAAAAFMRLRKR